MSNTIVIYIYIFNRRTLHSFALSHWTVPESLTAHYQGIDVFTRHLRTYPAVYEILTIASTQASAFIHIYLELSSIMRCAYPAITIGVEFERHLFGCGSHDPVAALFTVCGIKDQFNHSFLACRYLLPMRFSSFLDCDYFTIFYCFQKIFD